MGEGEANRQSMVLSKDAKLAAFEAIAWFAEVARHFGTNWALQNPPFLRLMQRQVCAAVRSSTP
jgi:hypothetical protein